MIDIGPQIAKAAVESPNTIAVYIRLSETMLGKTPGWAEPEGYIRIGEDVWQVKSNSQQTTASLGLCLYLKLAYVAPLRKFLISEGKYIPPRSKTELELEDLIFWEFLI